MKFLIGVCEKIDKIIRGFIWCDGCIMYWVFWDRCCLFKEKGGFGLRKISDVNDVFLVKFGWFFLYDFSLDWVVL